VPRSDERRVSRVSVPDVAAHRSTRGSLAHSNPHEGGDKRKWRRKPRAGRRRPARSGNSPVKKKGAAVAPFLILRVTTSGSWFLVQGSQIRLTLQCRVTRKPEPTNSKPEQELEPRTQNLEPRTRNRTKNPESGTRNPELSSILRPKSSRDESHPTARSDRPRPSLKSRGQRPCTSHRDAVAVNA
jgi:hypothetical protein